MSSNIHTADRPSIRLLQSGPECWMFPSLETTCTHLEHNMRFPRTSDCIPSHRNVWKNLGGVDNQTLSCWQRGEMSHGSLLCPTNVFILLCFLTSVAFVPPPLPVVSLGLIPLSLPLACWLLARSACCWNILLSPPYPRMQIYQMCDGIFSHLPNLFLFCFLSQGKLPRLTVY